MGNRIFRPARGHQKGPENLCRFPEKTVAGWLWHVPVFHLPAALPQYGECTGTYQRVKKQLPEKGHVVMMTITDKQFGMIEIFQGKKPAEPLETPQQLELF